MGLMPQSLVGRIQFVEAHLADWTAHATQIGSTSAEITALTTKTEAARAALTEQETAQETAKTKTAALHDAVEAMVVATSDLIKKVRAKAAVDGNAIYQLANIPAPATPQPAPAPGLPSNFTAEVDQTGAVKLTWKCPNAPSAKGTVYQVYRAVTGSNDWTALGVSGVREFVDETIPAGLTQVTYKVRGVRTTAAGPWATFNVTFGAGIANNGGVIASVTPGPKIAA